jgi:hypothetical protein
MKNVFTILGLLLATFSFSQSNNLIGSDANSEFEISNLEISVTVDSAEEVESTFKTEDIKEILKQLDGEEDVTFKITCNGDMMSNGVKSKMSYMIKGNTKKTDAFLKLIEKMRNGAINYYKNK